MSWNPALTPSCPDAQGAEAIETRIIPRNPGVVGVPPASRRQMVGRFIFFDQMGPATLHGLRQTWWNPVASSSEGIDAAKRQWRAERWGQGVFDRPPTDRADYIPLPERS